MFEKHFGLRENPFPAGHQMRFLYPSREHQEARAHLRYGIENREPFVLITGEVGTGKTTALYDALAEWGAQVSVALITNSALTRSELLEEICLRFGVALPADVSKPKMLALLERHLLSLRARGEHAVLLLDEAQNLATDLLEEIRLLSNLEVQGEKLLQIFLVAQPELEARLGRPELRQLRQRITVHYRLNPLSPEETAGYIHHRISVAGGNAWTTFPPETCREVYRVTHGIPREINTIAAQAMITAFSENASSVTSEHVNAARQEAEFSSVLAPQAPKLPTAAEMAAALGAPSGTAAEAPVATASQAEAGPSDVADAPPSNVTVSRAAAPPPAAPSAPFPLPKLPQSHSPSPHAEAPPAWSPGPHEKPEDRVEPVLREDLQVWNTPASELMKARLRAREGGLEPPVPAPPPAAASALQSPSAAAPPPPLRLPVPPYPAAAAESPAPRPGFPAPPPSLRSGLDAGLAEESRYRGAVPWMIGIAAIAVVLMAVVLTQRFGLINLPLPGGSPRPHAASDAAQLASGPTGGQAPGNAASATDPAIADSSARVATEAPASSNGAAAIGAAPRSAAPAGRTTRTPTPAAAASPTAASARTVTPEAAARHEAANIYGIAVGNYLDESRAGEESARLADLTGLSGRVVRNTSDGATMFRVVLGNFGDSPSAERAADRVLGQPGVREARVVVIAKTRAN